MASKRQIVPVTSYTGNPHVAPGATLITVNVPASTFRRLLDVDRRHSRRVYRTFDYAGPYLGWTCDNSALSMLAMLPGVTFERNP